MMMITLLLVVSDYVCISVKVIVKIDTTFAFVFCEVRVHYHYLITCGLRLWDDACGMMHLVPTN